MDWVSERDLAEKARMRLFCLPHAGSGAAGFYRWKRLLPEGIAVCPVMLPGREMRLGESPMRSVEEIVAALQGAVKPALDKPFAIFGHSMGALIAYEWARVIEREGAHGLVGLFVSGRNAPQMESGLKSLLELSDSELIMELGKRYGGTPEALLADGELRAVFLPILRADLSIVAAYSWSNYGDLHGRLRCFVRSLAGAEDRSVSDAGLERWQDVAGADFKTRRFPGGHFYHLGEGQAELLRFIAEELGEKGVSQKD